MSYVHVPLKGAPSGRIVPPAGSPNSKIALIGEAPGADEDRILKPFVGMAGSVLEACLHTAGLTKAEVYLTNVVKTRPKGNDIAPYFSTTKGRFTPLGWESVRELQAELNGIGANILVPLGNTALAAVTEERRSRVLRFRGYLTESSGLSPDRKVLPTIHPSAALRGKYLYRHIISTDLKKAREQSASPELKRPNRQLVWEFGHVGEVLEWLSYYEKQDIVAFDIEVLNFEVACISFSSDPAIAISVPLARTWTLHEEAEILLGIQRVLGNPRSIKVVQNGIFDIPFLLTRSGIHVAGPIHDTMVAHSIVYPELSKGLEFLVSVYGGTQEYYKDLVKFDNIKEES